MNCAGLYDSKTNSVDDDDGHTTVEALTPIFQANTVAPYLLAQALSPALERGSEHLVVTISSVMGTHAAMDDYHATHWAYSASKAAVNYAMIAFAKTHSTLKSVLIHPGWVKTKIGGHDAPLNPTDVATKLFNLIVNHAARLPNATLVNNDGEPISL